VARRIGLSRRVVTILEGESLLNDATGAGAVPGRHAAAIGAAIGPVEISGEVVRAVGGGSWSGRRCARVPVPAPAHHGSVAGQRVLVLAPFVVAAGAEAVHGSAWSPSW
jgi:CPA1 family monovalent cation:H+ antiporter